MGFNRLSGIVGIIYFIFFPKRLNSNSGIIFLVILVSFLADNCNYFFIRLVYPNGYIISNIWYLLNYLIVSWLFYRLLPNDKKLISILALIFYIGASVSFIYHYSFEDSNSFIKVQTSLVFAFLSLRLYFNLLKKPSGSLRNNSVFWIANAFFIYSTVTLLRNLFLQYLVFDLEISKEASSLIMVINLFANISKNLILFYVLVLIDKGYPKTIKPETS